MRDRIVQVMIQAWEKKRKKWIFLGVFNACLSGNWGKTKITRKTYFGKGKEVR